MSEKDYNINEATVVNEVEETNEVKEMEEPKEVENTEEPKTNKKGKKAQPKKETKVVEDTTKNVEVIPKFTGDKYISGKWYSFKKDTPKKVPKVVMHRLRISDAIYR